MSERRKREAIIDVACGGSRDRFSLFPLSSLSISFGIVYKWTCIQLALSFARPLACLVSSSTPSLSSGDVSVLCFHSDRPAKEGRGSAVLSLSFCTMRVLSRSLAHSIAVAATNGPISAQYLSVRDVRARSREAGTTDEVCQRLCGMCSVNFRAPHSKEFGAGHSVKWERSVSPLRAESVRNLSVSSCALIRCCRSLETGAKCERTMIIKGRRNCQDPLRR